MELVGISDSASDLIDGITGPAKQFRGFDHTIADQEFLGRFSHGFLEYFAKITPVETGTLRDALDGDVMHIVVLDISQGFFDIVVLDFAGCGLVLLYRPGIR